ncbi:hypothetical protein [Marinobacter nauticus]|uniref:Uncharacterized protein n=1 Tax=Marinobacter nauticus TaxID=2743 RepID=A0A368UX09_MARNT|nr:hypothetical protein [Marinobacter nauticus]RBP72419.1 hypothetical protein DET64_10717 [Marinobacter nauticus]RCW33346.1 hypothetical protein DET51_10717 [Marinobacter nauticus]
MRLKDPVEVFLLYLMHQWMESAPDNGRKGLYQGEPKVNSQMMRAAYILKTIGFAEEDKVFNKLAVHCRRNDGHSYISKDGGWMEKPLELGGGWYFEGGTSLVQKQDILSSLTKIGYSPTFVSAADTFVAGKPVSDFFPTDEEAKLLLSQIKLQASSKNL